MVERKWQAVRVGGILKQQHNTNKSRTRRKHWQSHHEYIHLSLLPYYISNMSMEESISLEETNKIRISLGLKPLIDDAAPADDKDKQAEDNYANRRDQENKERESK